MMYIIRVCHFLQVRFAVLWMLVALALSQVFRSEVAFVDRFQTYGSLMQALAKRLGQQSV